MRHVIHVQNVSGDFAYPSNQTCRKSLKWKVSTSADASAQPADDQLTLFSLGAADTDTRPSGGRWAASRDDLGRRL